ncbi:MAG TPA: thymidylate synthase (FAD), partial [Chloroflexi bacterium]|nr:thymidylate synthase (FAD) [Chloroflexota bacterium]
MNVLTDPKVYLVGRSAIDTSAVQQFLSDEGTAWTT